MLLAQANTEIPWQYFPPWLFGFLGFLSVVLLALMVIYYFKKVFGRRPPIDDALKDMVKHFKAELAREKNSVLKEVRLKLEPLVDRVEKIESSLEDIQLDRQRKWEELSKEMHAIAINVAELRAIQTRKNP